MGTTGAADTGHTLDTPHRTSELIFRYNNIFLTSLVSSPTRHQHSHLDTVRRKLDGGWVSIYFVKLRQGSGKDRQGMALKAKGLKA